MRRAARIDANQPVLVRQLRGIGCTVFPLHAVGQGFPDLAVGYRGVNYLWEVKNPDMPPSKRKLTKAEQKFFDGWEGQVDVVLDIVDCMNILGIAVVSGDEIPF